MDRKNIARAKEIENLLEEIEKRLDDKDKKIRINFTDGDNCGSSLMSNVTTVFRKDFRVAINRIVEVLTIDYLQGMKNELEEELEVLN